MQHTVNVYSSFQEVPAAVRERLSYPTQPNFLLSLDWFSLLFETTLRNSLWPRIYVVEDGVGTVEGALFCGVARRGAVRRLMSLTNFYTLEYSPALVQEGVMINALVERIVKYIAAERPRWDSIDFRLLKPETPEVRSLSNSLVSSGFNAYPFFQFENWYAVSQGTAFNTYFNERASQVRNTIARKQKKLEKTHNISVRVIRGASDELDAAVQDFITVYNRSWKRPEPYPAFIPALANACAKLGTLRLGLLYVDGRPAAGQLWINTDTKAIIYKLAYDEDYRELGVGSILSKELFRIAIDDDHVAEIDYGVGSEPYKKDWMSSVRKIEGVEAFNRRTLWGRLMIMRETVKPPVAAVFRKMAASFS